MICFSVTACSCFYDRRTPWGKIMTTYSSGLVGQFTFNVRNRIIPIQWRRWQCALSAVISRMLIVVVVVILKMSTSVGKNIWFFGRFWRSFVRHSWLRALGLQIGQFHHCEFRIFLPNNTIFLCSVAEAID